VTFTIATTVAVMSLLAVVAVYFVLVRKMGKKEEQ
jgi:hypothetical protein